MAKEENLKKIEMKVSVDCCDGCKKKVLKALSIKGVLKTEIHPTLPKVTVVGNVDPNRLIKKLAKCGKMAELLPAETDKKEIGDKKAGGENNTTKADKDKTKEGNSEKKPVLEQDKITNSSEDDKKKTKQVESTGTKVASEINKESKMTEGDDVINSVNDTTKIAAQATTTEYPQLKYFTNPGMDPNYMVPMTYYMQSSYPAPTPMVSSYPAPTPMASAYPVSAPMAYSYPALTPCCMREHCYHGMPVNQASSMQSLPPRFTEYFNDENTVGCHIM